MLEYKMTQRYLYSSHDKEQDGTQFLQIGVTMALSFILKISVCAIMSGFRKQGHNYNDLNNHTIHVAIT